MTHIGHLFDGSTGWEQRAGALQLVDRLPRDRYVSVLATLGPGAARALSSSSPSIEVLPAFGGISTLSGPAVARFATRHGIDLIHAWGVRAAAAARTLPRLPLVIQLYDPAVATCEARRLAALARPEAFAVICSSATVRRRLIEGGLPPDVAVVIRPGVDFELVNRWRRGSSRKRLGLRETERLVLVPEPVTRGGGQFEAVYAVTMRNHLSGGLRILVPGPSREERRIARFTATLPVSTALIKPRERYPFERLAAVSDVLLVTPRSDTSTTSIAWAMAARAAVIGTAVYSIAEIIAHKVNGLLLKQVPGRSMTAAILRCLQDREAQEKATEVARGQAYEVFGLRRYAEQTMRLYENVLTGNPPGEGITDSAIKSSGKLEEGAKDA